jgi:hypothetical protein
VQLFQGGSTAPAAYFSLDGGYTKLADYGRTSDPSDFLHTGIQGANDPFNEYYTGSTLQGLTLVDQKQLDALGFHLTSSNPISLQAQPQVHSNDLNYASTASGYNHFTDFLNFEASFPDLISAFGLNQTTMQNWYNQYEPAEKRVATFDGLDYIASYPDLIGAFAKAGSMGAVEDAGASHYIQNGVNEHRTTTFNGLDYIASYKDLIAAFGSNSDAGAFHSIEAGANEHRTATFDGLNYIASYPDLIQAFGANEQTGASHFINYGSHELRTTTFDGLSYIAQPELLRLTSLLTISTGARLTATKRTSPW